MAIINIKGIIGQDYTYSQFITDYATAGTEDIRLLINSPGGFVDEGENIAEFIRQHSNRFLSVINSGDVASIAASIFLALPFEKRFFDLSKGVALIHNPLFQPNTNENFTANELASLTDSMQATENKIKAYISKQTGADADVVGALMSINEPLNEAQLTSINFANLIKFQPIALYKMNNKEELVEQKTMLEKIIALLSPKKTAALMLTDATGNQIEFPDVPEGVQVKIGDKTTAPDGTYVMADGATYVVVAGVVTEIEVSVVNNAAALTAENEALKAEIEKMKAEADLNQKTLDAVKAQVIAMQGKIKSQMEIDAPPEKEEADQPVKFTYNGRKKQ